MLALCLLSSAIAFAQPALAETDAGHEEPKSVVVTCHVIDADVSWSAVPGPHVVGYDVYRKALGEQDYQRANDDLVQETQYEALGLSPQTTYDFGVIALYDDGQSSRMSDPATCTTA